MIIIFFKAFLASSTHASDYSADSPWIFGLENALVLWVTRVARWAKHAYCINVSRKESQNKLTFRNVRMEKKAEGTTISIFIISELLMAALFSADFYNI
jgi:hypothetical protein